jgi:hypothetical protein
MSQQIETPRLNAHEAQRIRVNLLRVAGLAAGLGVLMEAILVVGGNTTASLSSLLDHGLWPFLVCMAVAIGQSVSGGWPSRAAGISLVLTPAAFLIAKLFQRGMSVLLGGTEQGALLSSELLIEAGMRAVEYAVLAGALAWLAHQAWGGALAHVGTGLATGVVFGLLIAAVLPPSNLLGWTVEELVFPTGCALIIYASETLTRLLPEGPAPVA